MAFSSLKQRNFLRIIRFSRMIFFAFIIVLIISSIHFLYLGNNSYYLFARNKLEVYRNDSSFESTNIIIDSNFIYFETGIASRYGDSFQHKKTANGEWYSMHSYTAAHRDLPFGTILRITNMETDSVSFVIVNDRGPFVRSRLIDLSNSSISEINGGDLFRVKVEGLVPGSVDFEFDGIDDSFIGYSFNYPLISIRRNELTIIDSVDKFTDAVNIYKIMAPVYANEHFFLLVPKYDYMQGNEVCYYLGFINPKNIKLNRIIKETVKN